MIHYRQMTQRRDRDAPGGSSGQHSFNWADAEAWKLDVEKRLLYVETQLHILLSRQEEELEGHDQPHFDHHSD